MGQFMTFSNSNDHHGRYLKEMQQKTSENRVLETNKVSGDR